MLFQANFHCKTARGGGCLLLATKAPQEHWKRARSSSCSSPFNQLDASGITPSSDPAPKRKICYLVFSWLSQEIADQRLFESSFSLSCVCGEPRKVLLLPRETTRRASSFNTDRNRLAPLRGLLGVKLDIFRKGMHRDDRGPFLPRCSSPVEVQECSENAARSP